MPGSPKIGKKEVSYQFASVQDQINNTTSSNVPKLLAPQRAMLPNPHRSGSSVSRPRLGTLPTNSNARTELELITPSELLESVGLMRNEIGNFEKNLKPEQKTHEMKERIKFARELLVELEEDVELEVVDDDNKAIRISKNNVPVGLMAVEVFPKEENNELAFWIDHITTMPGTSGIGKQLVEQAVRLSQEKGFKGELRLSALYKPSQEFFENIGFQGDQIMDFDPSQCEKWEDKDGWRLVDQSHKQ